MTKDEREILEGGEEREKYEREGKVKGELRGKREGSREWNIENMAEGINAGRMQ